MVIFHSYVLSYFQFPPNPRHRECFGIALGPSQVHAVNDDAQLLSPGALLMWSGTGFYGIYGVCSPSKMGISWDFMEVNRNF
jgi:hypothetical protein